MISPDRYEPGLNRSYLELAEHYGTAVLPARPGPGFTTRRRCEQSVLIAERWILARLRHARLLFAGRAEQAIAVLTAELNARVVCGFGASRAELFAALDAPALGELPAQRAGTAYTYAAVEHLHRHRGGAHIQHLADQAKRHRVPVPVDLDVVVGAEPAAQPGGKAVGLRWWRTRSGYRTVPAAVLRKASWSGMHRTATRCRKC